MTTRNKQKALADLDDMGVDLLANNQEVSAPRPGVRQGQLDRQAILTERRSNELVGKHFLLSKDTILKLRIFKKQRKAEGRPATEAALVDELLSEALRDVQIPKDWRDAI
jgi:hypothetical protein